jgi:ribonuclease I
MMPDESLIQAEWEKHGKYLIKDFSLYEYSSS